MLRQLHSAGQGARAKRQAKLSRLGYFTSLPMLLRLFSILDAPAVAYGCKVRGSQCHGSLVSYAKKLQGVQVAFPRNVCGRLPVGPPAAAIFAEDPCSLKWLVQLVEFALCGFLTCHRFHCTMKSCKIMRRILLLGPHLPIGLPRLSNMSGHWVCQHPLLMMVQFSLTSLVIVAVLLANLMRSGRACMLPLGLHYLHPPKRSIRAHIIAGRRALVQCKSHTVSCPWVTDACTVCFVLARCSHFAH